MKSEGPWSWLSLFVLAAGLLFSLYLVLQAPDDVFYAGDAGIKFLVARQFQQGHWGTDLRPPPDERVRELWRQGYFPIHEHFVYVIDGRYVQRYAVFFPLLTAPFLTLLGHRGLYVVPLLALWVVWLRFWLLGRKLRLSPFAAALGLFALIFASPLTLYGAMYCEHTLAVALSFCGIAAIVGPEGSWPTVRQFAAAGLLLGLACWQRVENFSLAAAVVVAWAWPCHRAGRMKDLLTLSVAVAASVAALVAVNLWLYRHPLGVQSFVIVRDQSFVKHLLTESLYLYWILNRDLFAYTPIAFFVVVFGLAALLRPKRGSLLWRWLLLVLLLHSLTTPLLFINSGGMQWGPRYLLNSVPLLCLTAAMLLSDLRSQQTPAALASALLLPLLVLGFYRNTVDGTADLTANYNERVLPLLHLVRGRDDKYVVINNHYIAQELAAEWERRTFLHAEDVDRLLGVAAELHEDGISRFLLIVGYFKGPVERHPVLSGETDQLHVECRLLGQYGTNYVAYEVQVTQKPAP